MSYVAEVIAVGTELLLGDIINTNAQFISRGLAELGIEVHHQVVVGDNAQRMTAVVEQARSRADILIFTGGLGPTYDDITKEVICACFGKELVIDDRSAARIVAMYRKRGNNVPMTENNFRQAMVPEGCTIFQNDWGAAPGCAFEQDGKHVIILPGPPRECEPMFRTCVVPYLRSLSEDMIFSQVVRIYGMGESRVESILHDRMVEMTNPTLAPYAGTGEVCVRITAKAPSEEEAMALIAPEIEYVKKALGDVVYGVDVESMEEAVLRLLKIKQKTMAAAESCTGGLIAKRMTDTAGASWFFRGGVVVYSNEAKRDLLGIPTELLEEFGAVSNVTAEAMAVAVREKLGVDIGVSVTGVAGPGPDENGNPEGLVYIGVATADSVQVQIVNLPGGREFIRTVAATKAMDMTRRVLEGMEHA